jgi:hypothetical protein
LWRPDSPQRGLVDLGLEGRLGSVGQFSVMAVSINPGATALTLMFLEPNSFAADFPSANSPALVAAYAAWPAFPVSPTMLEISTIDPARCFIIGFATAPHR